MSKERYLLKQTLYLLMTGSFNRERDSVLCDEIINQIEALLAEPEEEPVGYINPEHLKYDSCRLWKEPGCNGINKPLWNRPPRQPVQLSDDEKYEIAEKRYFVSRCEYTC